jgi:hypothetical protein
VVIIPHKNKMDAGLALLTAGIVSLVIGVLILFVLNYSNDYGAYGFKMGLIISAVAIAVLFASLFKVTATLCG